MGTYHPLKKDTNPVAGDKITLAWLFRHVPMGFWIIAVGTLLTAFGVGIRAGQIDWIRQFFTKP
ncbi:MAG: hypothetical protein NT154_34300 [Verrucomicrobia bacterium]|nr:hypothetical protein [Verrucomicrobiota bacterium]